MATPQKYKFYFTIIEDSVEKFIYVDSSGNITTTDDIALGLSNPLRNSPDNWEDVEQEWVRSESLHGIFTKISNEYSFSGDGAKILRHCIFTQGYASKLKLRVDIRLDDATGWIYNIFSINDVDFTSFNDDHTNVSIALFESGLGTKFKSALDVPYEIPLSGADLVTTEHHGTTLRCKFNWRYGDSSLNTAAFGSSTPLPSLTPNGEYATLLMVVLQNDGLRPIVNDKTCDPIRMGVQQQNEFYMNASRDQSDQYGHWILQAGQYIDNLKLNYKASFKWRWINIGSTPYPPSQSGYFKIDLIISKDLSTFRSKINLYNGSWEYTTTPFTYYTENIDISDLDIGYLDIDERIYIVCTVMSDALIPTNDLNWQIETYNTINSNISIYCTFIADPTIVKGFQWHKLWNKLVNKFSSISSGVSNYISSPSTFVKGCYPSKVILTNGNALKGIDNSIFKIKMGDMIQDAQTTWAVGVGLSGDDIAIEHLSAFYDDTSIITNLGELTDWEITPLNKIGTKIIIGNKFDDTDTLNGQYDYNTKSTFKTDVLMDSERTLEVSSPFVSSVYNIEKLRVSEHGKDTTGNKINEDIYKYSIENTTDLSNTLVRYPSSTDYVTVIGGVASQTAYNSEFSPKNCYNRIKGVFNGYTYPSTLPFTFQISDRYKGMTSNFYNPPLASWFGSVVESADITPDGQEMYWLPYKVRFKSVVPINLNDLLAVNPYGVFIGKVKGIEVRIFMTSVKMKPSNRNVFEWEGILSPSNDIAKLIF